MEIQAQHGSKTRRKALRQDVRHDLGTTREDAPGLGRILKAARHLDKLLRMTTDNVYSITIVKKVDHKDTIPGLMEMNEDIDNWVKTNW